jgi:hypothetical protein
MRDIAVNEKYGTDYTVHYNTDVPVKGAMMHVLTPVYPWFKAVIEEGGIPGLLWSDYNCDGFVTETQERELRFYRDKLETFLASPAGIRMTTRGVRAPDNSWMKKTKPRKSYFLP